MSIIESVLSTLQPAIIIVVFASIMIVLAVVERISISFGTFKDFKPTIVSLGILGTFIGVFIGLWYFDTDNISESVPKLLEGLKIAFVTSIIGMIIASVLAIWEKFSKKAQGDDETEIMQSINRSLLNFQEDSKKGFATLHDQMSLLRKENADKLSTLVEATNNGFETTNKSLKEAIDTLSKGATEEIIQALEKVISDFNQNLTKQFGDNFKELNQACLKLVEWQRDYKETMDESQKQINRLLDSFERTDNTLEKIHKRNEETADVYEKLEIIIKTIDKQISSMTDLLKTYQGLSGDADNMFQTVKNRLNETSSHMDEFATAMKQSIHEQSETFNKLNEDMKSQASGIFETMKDGLNETNSEMSTFAKEIQKSINMQSETLGTLTNKLGTQLQTSLQELEKSLTTLTNEFAKNYDEFLKRFQEVQQARLHEEE